jgi:aerobic carbon-monoxide dehydrogenase small subunit
MSTAIPLSLEVNGRDVTTHVEVNESLADVLRAHAGATDVKVGCGEGVCGTCTVLLDGEPVNSCLVFAVQAQGRRVATLRGLADESGGLHPLQRRFLRHGASQCGFCTPGMVLTAEWFIAHNSSADREQIRAALAGNICRCTGYTKIVDAVHGYALELEGLSEEVSDVG